MLEEKLQELSNQGCEDNRMWFLCTCGVFAGLQGSSSEQDSCRVAVQQVRQILHRNLPAAVGINAASLTPEETVGIEPQMVIYGTASDFIHFLDSNTVWDEDYDALILLELSEVCKQVKEREQGDWLFWRNQGGYQI